MLNYESQKNTQDLVIQDMFVYILVLQTHTVFIIDDNGKRFRGIIDENISLFMIKKIYIFVK